MSFLHFAAGTREDRNMILKTVKKEEEFRCVRAACDKEEARVAIKTLERFHYFERGSKTRRESDRGVLEGFQRWHELVT